MSECHADHSFIAVGRTDGRTRGEWPKCQDVCVGEEGVGDRGTHAAAQLTNEGMVG